MRATRKGVLTVSQATRRATGQAPAAVRRKGFKAELDGPQERMRTSGGQVADLASVAGAVVEAVARAMSCQRPVGTGRADRG